MSFEQFVAGLAFAVFMAFMVGVIVGMGLVKKL